MNNIVNRESLANSFLPTNYSMEDLKSFQRLNVSENE